MDFSIFDLVVGSIILLLGLKGILNGFFKELFGLIGIIGGIFVGSRVASDVGTLLSEAIFKFESPAAISFLGFLVTLALFWGSMIGAGILFKKFSKCHDFRVIQLIFMRSLRINSTPPADNFTCLDGRVGGVDGQD